MGDSSNAAMLLLGTDPVDGIFRANFEKAKVDVSCEAFLS